MFKNLVFKSHSVKIPFLGCRQDLSVKKSLFGSESLILMESDDFVEELRRFFLLIPETLKMNFLSFTFLFCFSLNVFSLNFNVQFLSFCFSILPYRGCKYTVKIFLLFI